MNDINKMGEFINSWGEISFGFMVGFVLLKNSDVCKSGIRVAYAGLGYGLGFALLMNWFRLAQLV
mgnify:CR=1 FL=1